MHTGCISHKVPVSDIPISDIPISGIPIGGGPIVSTVEDYAPSYQVDTLRAAILHRHREKDVSPFSRKLAGTIVEVQAADMPASMPEFRRLFPDREQR